jgi:hypothetical protein
MIGTIMRQLNAGDYVQFYINNNVGSTVSYGSNTKNNYVQIFRISDSLGSSSATPSISAKYQVTGSVTPANNTIINFAQKVYDTANAVTTGASWAFTAPTSGRYSVKCAIGNNSNVANTINQYWGIGAYVNGTLKGDLGYFIVQTTTSISPTVNGSDTVYMNANDTLSIKNISNLTNQTTLGTGTTSYVTIDYVGP